MLNKSAPKTRYINGRSLTAAADLGKELGLLLSSLCLPGLRPVFVCIGSDRVTGDSLGPLVGSKLAQSPHFPFPVYGTLDFPIHALNLEGAMSAIKHLHPRSPVVAVDACLGSRRHQQYITVSAGSLSPGAGVDKALIEVGDIAITGIISPSGKQAHFFLQTTRLATVMSMADRISQGILMGCGCILANA